MRTSEKVVGCCGFCSLSLCFVNTNYQSRMRQIETLLV